MKANLKLFGVTEIQLGMNQFLFYKIYKKKKKSQNRYLLLSDNSCG